MQIGVDKWLQAVFDEVITIPETKGMKKSDLTNEQKFFLVWSRSPHKISIQLDVFLNRESWIFDTVSFVCFKILFQKHDGKSILDVIAVMNLYETDRIKKGREIKMLHHVLDFKNKLPSCNE